MAEYTILDLRFSEPIDYQEMTRWVWRIPALFEFMIGARTEAPVYQLPTTQTRMWNDEPREVVAEYWFIPAWRRAAESALPRESGRLTVERRLSVTLGSLLNLFAGDNDELFYLANIIQSADDTRFPIPQRFGELIGCLENFDNREFGSGADPFFDDRLRSLTRVVQEHGSVSDQMLFERMRGGTRNSLSLLLRLQRLHSFWSAAGFRGNPDLRRIRDLRNLVPHGRGLQVSRDVAQEMATYLRYLAALARYHVFRALGCTDQEIAAAFRAQPHRYGLFVPVPPST